MIKYKLICEVCGKKEIYKNLKQAYLDGWDIPPYMGEFGIISPRTCPNCTIENTVWLKIMRHGSDALNSHDLEVIERIKHEPESLYFNDDKE